MIETKKHESNISKQIELMKACIHCGMCLPACPTYLIDGNEGDSPRGRLYLIKDLLDAEKKMAETKIQGHENTDCQEKTNENKDEILKNFSSLRFDNKGNLKLKDKAQEYLDNCLNCRACESACPSGVEYASILDYARNVKKQSTHSKGFKALVRRFAFKNILPSRNLLNFLRACYEPIALTYKFLPFLPKLSKIQPKLKEKYIHIKTNKTYYSNVSNEDLERHYDSKNIPSDHDRTITLPLGCVMDTLYSHVHLATIMVLNAFGYHVYVPESTCCGALAYHSSESEIGEKQLEKFLNLCTTENPNKEEPSSFPKLKSPQTVVFNSAGCGAFVKDHVKNFMNKNSFSGTNNRDLKTIDLVEALTDAPFKPKLNFLKSNSLELSESTRNKKSQNNFSNRKTVFATYQPACHLNHAQGLKDEWLDLLKEIPNLKLAALEEADVCCGSAGFYNLIKSKMANAIGKRKAGFITNTNANIIISANPGCLSQIQAHLGDGYEVIHPAEILAKTI